MQGAKDSIKIGAVVLASILGIWGATILISGASGLTRRNTYYVFVEFDNARGLKPNMKVTADGLEVGYVEWVRRDDTTRIPTAKIRISKAVTVYSGSHFVIAQTGLIGDHELTLEDPEPSEQGAEVKEGSKLLGTTEKGLQDMVARADQILQRVDTLLGDDSMGGALRDMTGSVNESLQKVNGIVDQVDGLMSANTKLITGSMQNFQAMSSNFLRLSSNLEQTSIAIRDLSTDPKNREQFDTVLANLNAASASLAATSAQAEKLSGDEELQQNIKDTLRLTKETLEETKKSVTQFQSTMGSVDGLLKDAGGLVKGVGGTLDRINKKTGGGKDKGSKDPSGAAGSGKSGDTDNCDNERGLEATAGFYLRGIDYNGNEHVDGHDRLVADAKARIGYNGKYIATGVDNIGDGGEINLLLGYGSAVSGGSVRGGVYRGELGAGLAWYGGGFGAEVTAYGPQDPRLDAYGYVPVGDSVDIVVGVEDATGSAKITAGAGVKF